MIRRSDTYAAVSASKTPTTRTARTWSEDDRKLAISLAFMLLALVIWFGSSLIFGKPPSSADLLAGNSTHTASSRSEDRLSRAAGLSEN
jgi:hypothetical protein